MSEAGKPKGPRRTDTKIAGAIRIARTHPDRCDALLALIKHRDPMGAVETATIKAEKEHSARMFGLRLEREFARELDGMNPDLVQIVRASVEAVKTAFDAETAARSHGEDNGDPEDDAAAGAPVGGGA